MAYAARRRGTAITVYAAETASPTKISRIRSLGAEVKLVGQDFDEAKEHARTVAKDTNAVFIELKMGANQRLLPEREPWLWRSRDRRKLSTPYSSLWEMVRSSPELAAGFGLALPERA
jgi:Pyridoxal-phosphate dependent enzyme